VGFGSFFVNRKIEKYARITKKPPAEKKWIELDILFS
jgi:hypothetical protein